MKNTIKQLYNIDSKALIKYSNKVYKVKDENDNKYCFKFCNNQCNNLLIEKINALNLSSNFVMPLKTCVRSNQGYINNKPFYMFNWIDDDNVDSKDLKLKYYLTMISNLHKKSSYSLNVSISFFNELSMKIEENIQDVYQYYEKIIATIEKNEYYSPFQWYLYFHFKDIIYSLDKSREHLEDFKKIVKDKLSIRQVINHLNFSYDHVFIIQDKIIANDKMKLASPIYDLVDLVNKIEFGTIDVSSLFEVYLGNNQLYDYEIKWLLSMLYVTDKIKFTDNDFDNLKKLMNLIFKIKSINEIEKIIQKK